MGQNTPQTDIDCFEDFAVFSGRKCYDVCVKAELFFLNIRVFSASLVLCARVTLATTTDWWNSTANCRSPYFCLKTFLWP